MHICTAEKKYKCSTESFNGREDAVIYTLIIPVEKIHESI